MKIAFRVVLVLTVLPVVLALLGMGLSSAFSCSGMDHIETCGVAWGQQVVAPLIAFVWVSVFVVPIGGLTLAVLAGVQFALNARKRDG
jgi:hypothetical protein